MKPLVISAHQPDFLPYSGFWWKLANSDLMDLRYRAQYTDRGRHRRVMMRDEWCSVPTFGQQHYSPIDKVRIDLAKAKTTVPNIIKGRYRGAPYFKKEGPALLDVIESIETEYLWEWNLRLLLHVRDVLGITTPFTLGAEQVGTKAEGCASLMRVYPPGSIYLSGSGARKYMTDEDFTALGVPLQWSRHKPVTGDSVLTLLFDYADPMELIMMEEE